MHAFALRALEATRMRGNAAALVSLSSSSPRRTGHEQSEIHRDRRQAPSVAGRRREQNRGRGEVRAADPFRIEGRPTADRTAAGWYLEPLLFSLLTPRALHADRRTRRRPRGPAGTDGSNPPPSSGESANFRFLAGCGRLRDARGRRRAPGADASTTPGRALPPL